MQADRAAIVANYFKAGYLTSSFRETATQVSKNDPHHINVVYHIYEGPRVFTGDVLTLGRVHTRAAPHRSGHCASSSPISRSPKQICSPPAAISTTTPASSTGLRSIPKRQITTQTSEDVLVKVHEAKRNEFTYGFGFEVINRGGSIPSGTAALPNLPPVGLPSNFKTSQVTFYGPRGSVQYTRNNLRGKGESLSFTAFAGRLDQRAAIYYINPNFRWSSWKSTVFIRRRTQ